MAYTFQKKKEELIAKMSKVYFEVVLPIVASDDPILYSGIGEGANKFLSNAYINSFKFSTKNPYKHCKKKWLITDYISAKAQIEMDKGNYTNLQFEHIVPKAIYQQHFMNEFKNNKQGLTANYINDVLKNCWVLATVTKEEHDDLEEIEKENKWKLDDYLSNYKIRYEKANIQIDKNKLLENGTLIIKL